MHGLPEILTSENRGQFTSNEMESFIKVNGITHNKINRYGSKQMDRLSDLIALLRKLYNLLLTKDVIGNMNRVHSC